jgi:hypothetical protein
MSLNSATAGCPKIGRNPEEIELGVFFAGPPDTEAVKKLRGTNVKRVILPLPPAGRDKVLPILDEYAKML